MGKKLFWKKWESIKNKLKYQWEKLTEDDFTHIIRNKTDIASTLQIRYGYTRWQAEKAVRNFFRYRRYNIHAE